MAKIPPPRTPLTDKTGMVSPEWYRWFAQFERDFGDGIPGAGDGLTADEDGNLTIEAGGVTNAMLRDSLGCSVIGRFQDSAGPPADIVAGANGRVLMRADDILVFRELTTSGSLSDGDFGDIVISGGGTALTVDANAISNAKFRQSAGLSVVARAANSTGNVADVSGTASQFLGINAAGTSLAFQTLAGDATLSGPTITLATVNSNVGSFGGADKTITATVNAKGLVTAFAETAIAVTASQVTDFSEAADDRIASLIQNGAGITWAYNDAAGTLTPTVAPAVGSITGLGSNVATFLATPSSANLAGAVTDETGSGQLVFASGPTITSPSITSPSITGGSITNPTIASPSITSGVLVDPTISEATLVTIRTGYTTTATSAGTTTLAKTSSYAQVFTGSSTQTVRLPADDPVEHVGDGHQHLIVNKSTGAVTVQTELADEIFVLAGGTSALFQANRDLPNGATYWDYQYWGSIIASGKSLTVSNTLTLTGTDGSSVAFGGGGTVLYSGGAAGTPSSITLTNATGLPTAGLLDDAVTYAKMQDISATSRILGRITAGAGDTEELTAANVKTILALAQADISGLTTADSPQFTAINIGHATDTTITRVSAGVVAVEGSTVAMLGTAQTFTADQRNTAKLALGEDAPAAKLDIQQDADTNVNGIRIARSNEGDAMFLYMSATPFSGFNDALNFYSVAFAANIAAIDRAGHAVFLGTVRTGSYTVATLPSASTFLAGARAFVTDATATTFASVVAGGGANPVPVYSDGTDWRIG